VPETTYARPARISFASQEKDECLKLANEKKYSSVQEAATELFGTLPYESTCIAGGSTFVAKSTVDRLIKAHKFYAIVQLQNDTRHMLWVKEN
jgi:hypothetical protein